MNLIRTMFIAAATSLLLVQCREPEKKQAEEKSKPQRPPAPEWKKPGKEVGYHAVPAKQWFRNSKDSLDSIQQKIVLVVNRVDMANLPALDSVLIPDDLSGDLVYYLPFPLKADGLEEIPKVIFFSYPSQSFGAYEYGNLVYAGPTNMGRKKDPTPTGLYFTNWKAEKTTSTFNDEWELKWNFNIENKEGIGWHQYALPGYPASHSCLRLLDDDAQYLYKWADEWKLKGTDSVLQKGTPVIVFGDYPFGGRKPWLNLLSDAHALDISANELEALAQPYIRDITAAQRQ